jgi:hypothetical protein
VHCNNIIKKIKKNKKPGLSRYFFSMPSKSSSWMVFIVVLIFLRSTSIGQRKRKKTVLTNGKAAGPVL